MTPKDSLCELLALYWEGQVCHQTSVTQISRFPLNLKRFAHRFLCASRTRPFQYRFTTTVIKWPAWTTALCRVCETQNSGKALFFFAKQESKYPRNPLDLKLSQKSCLQQIYAPVFIMRQMLSPFSRMRPAFEDAENIQFSRYRVCLKHHKTQEALCLEFKV